MKKQIRYVHIDELNKFHSIEKQLKIITDNNPDIEVFRTGVIKIDNTMIYPPKNFKLLEITDYENDGQ